MLNLDDEEYIKELRETITFSVNGLYLERCVSIIDRLTSRVRELEEEDKQWDKHSLVEIVKERDALKEELKRRQERDRWWDNHSRTEIFMARDKYMEENRRLREALEIIARVNDPLNGLALVMSKTAINALAQAAKKEGEWRKIK